jgi:predicted Zn-dependent peptidase
MKNISDKLNIYKRKFNNLNTIYLKRSGINSCVALVTIKYGSIYKRIINDSTIFEIPDGTAHFLEHRLFDLNGKDANIMFSEFGADSNAFTSNKTTSYYFVTVENFMENLSILLDLAFSERDFDEKKIKKEREIIRNEINMHEDDPYTLGYYLLLDSMYWFNPVKTKVIGSVESISKINSSILKKAHDTFYTLKNSTLLICGNIDETELFENLTKYLNNYQFKYTQIRDISNIQEPIYPKYRFKIEYSRITKDLLFLGFKFQKAKLTLKEIIMIDIILDVIFGSMSEFSDYLYSEMLVDDTFNYSFNWEENSNSIIISGYTENYEKLITEIKKEIEKRSVSGISDEELEIIRKNIIGNSYSIIDKPGDLVMEISTLTLIGDYLIDDYLDELKKISTLDINEFISVVLPLNNTSTVVISPFQDT